MADEPPGPIDWPGLMRLGLGALRLSPDAFWKMTPSEFRHALEGAGIVPISGATFGRARLAEMMAAFPDRTAHADETEVTDGSARGI